MEDGLNREIYSLGPMILFALIAMTALPLIASVLTGLGVLGGLAAGGGDGAGWAVIGTVIILIQYLGGAAIAGPAFAVLTALAGRRGWANIFTITVCAAIAMLVGLFSPYGAPHILADLQRDGSWPLVEVSAVSIAIMVTYWAIFAEIRKRQVAPVRRPLA